MKKLNIIKLILFFLCLNSYTQAQDTTVTVIGKVWPIEKANEWYSNYKWINGADFLPSTAINQLEMWQAETFDPNTIDKELRWAKNIGFNTMRVYLHSVAWKKDPSGFKNRVAQYLTIADKHDIKTIFVFFDDCWNKEGFAGKQPEPQTGIHNSGWVQDPGDPMSKDPNNFPALEKYVKDVMNTFKADERILLWDLYNEPGNSGKFNTSFPLLKNVITWARTVEPNQPISIGLWAWNFHALNAMQALNSDIITYHNYEEPDLHKRTIDMLKAFGRPMICTEYMARTRNSRLANIMPMLKKENVGAINWGLVAGKSNTIFAWDAPLTAGGQPIEWFHDIFKKDGSAYREDEIQLIKKLNEIK
jgi:hypothetical protein